MKTYRTLLVVSIALILTGCCGTAPTVKTEYVFKPIPAALLLPCEGTPPPVKTQYLAAGQDDREEMWTETYRRQELKRQLCNVDKKKLREWNAEQKALYSKTKEAP
jgi:hypothetical protein